MSPARVLPAAVQTLTGLDQWVTWRLELDDKGKPTKEPYQARPGDVHASATDPATWASYAAVQAVAARFDGTGFMVSQGPYCGIDLDHCISPETGAVAPWAQAVVDHFKSYTEATPSGEGLRIWVEGALPKHAARVFKQADHGRVEIYDRNSPRYFTVTGRQWGGTPETIEPRQAELEAWHAALVAAKAAAQRVPARTAESGPRPAPSRTRDIRRASCPSHPCRPLTGQKLFDRFAVQQGSVYALFLDDPEFLVREHLAAMDLLDHPDLHVAT